MKPLSPILMALSVAVTMLLHCSAVLAEYADNGDGTVTDNATGLMWQQTHPSGTYLWDDALNYCENLVLNNDGAWTSGSPNSSGAKYADWRLPTVKELASLIDLTTFNPAINTTYFPGTLPWNFWSSTTDESTPAKAWNVYYLNGVTNTADKTSENRYVRAVRAGQAESFDNLALWPVPDTGQAQSHTATFGEDCDYEINTLSYTKLGAGCSDLPDNATDWNMVRDDVTGILWEVKHNKDSSKNYADPNDADNTYTWYDGTTGIPGEGTDTLDFITALNAEGYGGCYDWRLPTLYELWSIGDYGRFGPAVDTDFFPDAQHNHYWSSVIVAGGSMEAWSRDFYAGLLMRSYMGSANFFVRAVCGGDCGSPAELMIIKAGTGSGTVTGSDGTIDCGSDCAALYRQGAQVVLSASADAGSEFNGWSGGGCSGTDNCTVALTVDVEITATFSALSATTTTTTIAGSTTTTTIQEKPCPAKKVLGADNPKLDSLRAFRDKRLSQSAGGRRLINLYYTNAGSINAALENSPVLRASARRILEAIAPVVGNRVE